MPGRQSTGPRSLQGVKRKDKKQTQKRSLNALAIAEQQHPSKSKIRHSRLGTSEPDSSSRKRVHEKSGTDEEDDPRKSKRPRAGDTDRYGNEIEGGSDSDGNEWVLGAVDNDDDSDLDSDEAMGESDEERFEGFTFRGSSSTGNNRKSQKPKTAPEAIGGENDEIDLDEGMSDDESDELGENAIDLADAMEENSADDESSEASGDEASELTDFADFSDHDDVADPKKLALLEGFVSSMNDPADFPVSRVPINDNQEAHTPSKFGITSKQKLTLADLQSSISDPNIRKSLKLLAEDTKPSSKRGGIPKKLEVPLAKRQQDRLDRAAAYAKSKETLNRWIDTVKHNRRAEHLSFPLKDPNAAVAQGSQRMLPTVNSKPVNDLESEIQKLLHESGLGPTTRTDEEDPDDTFTELPANKVSVEEVQARRAELRRARDLLFREEKRAKRIKKIKSRSYRKVHRKERERLAQSEKDAFAAAGVEDSETEQERNDRRRAEERMGQRHRESRWAKSVKDSGRAAWDEDARSGVIEMARRNEELRKRMEGKTVDSESATSESETSDDEEGDDVDDKEQRDKSKALGRLREVDKDGNHVESRLSSMPFMKKADSLRREQNKAIVDSIERQLDGEETPSGDEQSEGTGRRSYGPLEKKASNKRPSQPEQRSDFEEKPVSDDENEIRFQNDDEDAEIIVDAANSADRPNNKKSTISRHHLTSPQEPPVELSSIIEDNPWLSTTTTHRHKKDRKTKDDRAGAIISNFPASNANTASSPSSSQPSTKTPNPRSALKGARAAATNTSPQPPTSNTTQPPNLPSRADSDDDPEEQHQPFILKNDDLIRRAFAGDAVVADFAAEKAATITSESTKTIDTTLPGWGSWVGEGLNKHDRKRAQSLRTTTTEKGVDANKRKDAKLEKVIINEKRVKKNGKYLASSLPHPFETRAQYERSLRLPVGPEWTTKETFQGMTKPRVMVKQGVIGPMSRPMV